MEKLVTIRCNNNGKELDVPIGTTLEWSCERQSKQQGRGYALPSISPEKY